MLGCSWDGLTRTANRRKNGATLIMSIPLYGQLPDSKICEATVLDNYCTLLEIQGCLYTRLCYCWLGVMNFETGWGRVYICWCHLCDWMLDSVCGNHDESTSVLYQGGFQAAVLTAWVILFGWQYLYYTEQAQLVHTNITAHIHVLQFCISIITEIHTQLGHVWCMLWLECLHILCMWPVYCGLGVTVWETFTIIACHTSLHVHSPVIMWVYSFPVVPLVTVIVDLCFCYCDYGLFSLLLCIFRITQVYSCFWSGYMVLA